MITFNMPRKVPTSKGVLQSSKRRLSAMENDHVNKEDISRNTKKRKNDVQSGKKETTLAGPSRVISSLCSSKQIASCIDSSAHSSNKSGKKCEELCLICMDTSDQLNLPASLNPVVSIVPYHSTCAVRAKSQAKKLHTSSATDVFGENVSDTSKSTDTCNFQGEVRCLICMDTKSYCRYKSLECGHKFHFICVRTWLQCNDSCPICMPYKSERNTLNAFTDEDISDIHEGRSCSICLDTVESSNFDILSCSHSFHVVCIQAWFGVKDVCPVCMGCNPSDLAEDDFHDLRENMQCMICKNAETFIDFEYLSCDHSFHNVCLENWFQLGTSCPICVPYDSASGTSDKLEGNHANTEQCVICIDTEESFSFQNLSCGHSFHASCIQTWFQIKKSCPVCIPPDFLSQNTSSFTNDYQELLCMICLGAEQSSEFDMISCDLKNNIWHSFHSKCMETWFQENDSCPICIPDNVVNSPSHIPDENEIVKCAICVDTEDYTDIEFLACCHSFHSLCIRSWLKKKNKCPICNTVIFANSYSYSDHNQPLPCA